MQELAALRDPLQRVALLAEPMLRLTQLLSLVNRPLLLLAVALGALLAWGLVTYLAIRLAIRQPIASRP